MDVACVGRFVLSGYLLCVLPSVLSHQGHDHKHAWHAGQVRHHHGGREHTHLSHLDSNHHHLEGKVTVDEWEPFGELIDIDSKPLLSSTRLCKTVSVP